MSDVTPEKRAYHFIRGGLPAGTSPDEVIYALAYEFRLAQNEALERAAEELDRGGSSTEASAVRQLKHSLKYERRAPWMKTAT